MTALWMLVWFLGACGPSGTGGADTSVESRAGSTPFVGTSEPMEIPGVALTLGSGEVVVGERIASWDQRTWQWTPADETWVAIFDVTRWDGGAGLDAVRLFRQSEVAASEPVGIAGPSWRDTLRTEGLVWSRPPLDGRSWVIRGHDGYHLTEDGYGDFAWDLVRTDAYGDRFSGIGAANSDYLAWGQPVYAAHGGTVVEVERDAVDNLPGAYPPGAVNNLVGIRVSAQLVQYYLHFREGSIPAAIQVGAEVAAGDRLGDVGNTGVTLEPHLHMTLHAWVDSPTPRFWSVPSEWADVEIGPALVGSSHLDHGVPATGEWVATEPF